MIENRLNKMLRIRLIGKHLATGCIKFKRGSPSAELLVEQLRDFPLGAHDDGPDALEMSIRLAEKILRPPDDDGLGAAQRLEAGG